MTNYDYEGEGENEPKLKGIIAVMAVIFVFMWVLFFCRNWESIAMGILRLFSIV